jgi:hypothetical protein
VNAEVPDYLAALFRDSVRFRTVDAPGVRPADVVNVEWLAVADTDPQSLAKDTLPFLALPLHAEPDGGDIQSARVLVSAEGRDVGIAQAIVALLCPERCAIDLLHVTWLPSIVSSPIDERGVDNPHPTSLLAYQGAREALVDRAEELRAVGFAVSTYLRMSRNPEDAIVAFARGRRPLLGVLGLGRHGAGIGRVLMRETALPTLYLSVRG